MDRVPTSSMRAESVFYWIRQEKRKRRDAIAHLEAKTMYFYTEAKSSMHSRYEAIAKMETQMNEKEEVDLPPLPIHEVNIEEQTDKNEDGVDGELFYWYNNQNCEDENNFLTQSTPVGGVTSAWGGCPAVKF